MLIFHIADPVDWRRATTGEPYATSTRGRTLAEEGFIHCSRFDQLDGVLGFAYVDAPGPLSLLVVDTDLLDASWRLDDVPEAGDVYPHVYGPIDLGAVVEVLPLSRDAAGRWQLPTPPAGSAASP